MEKAMRNVPGGGARDPAIRSDFNIQKDDFRKTASQMMGAGFIFWDPVAKRNKALL
jgi:hypothetical protein